MDKEYIQKCPDGFNIKFKQSDDFFIIVKNGNLVCHIVMFLISIIIGIFLFLFFWSSPSVLKKILSPFLLIFFPLLVLLRNRRIIFQLSKSGLLMQKKFLFWNTSRYIKSETMHVLKQGYFPHMTGSDEYLTFHDSWSLNILSGNERIFLFEFEKIEKINWLVWIPMNTIHPNTK